MEEQQKLQQLVDSIEGQYKSIVLQMLNETADEFDKLDLTDEQREVYNQFTGAFGNKVLQIQIKVEGKQ